MLRKATLLIFFLVISAMFFSQPNWVHADEGVPVEAEAIQPPDDTDFHHGKKCTRFTRGSHWVDVCVAVDVHDWLYYKQGIVQFTRSYSGPNVGGNVTLYNSQGQNLIDSGWTWGTGSSFNIVSGWVNPRFNCYHAVADIAIYWPDGHLQTVNGLTSDPPYCH